MPQFSIIIPVYNRAKHIQRCVESVLDQKIQDFEILIVDDGSKDKTVEKVNEIIKQNHKVRLFKFEENQGRCAARNEGLKNAKGDWICYLDSDDVYYPDHLEVIAEMIEKNPNHKAFATSQHINGSRKEDRIKNSSNSVIALSLNDFIEKNPLTANQICVHRSIEVKWSNERIPISEDLLYFRELVLETNIIKTPKVTTNLIDHEERTMNNASVDNFVKYNIMTAELFVSRHIIPERIKNRILSHTYLLCANVYLSSKRKSESLDLLKKSIRFGSTFLSGLFYLALFKIVFKK